MESKGKNIIIISLIAIVLVMAAGYAAFYTNLKIKGVVMVSTNWFVHITEIKVDEGGTVGSGSDKNKAIEDGQLTAVFESELVSPGDSVTYDVTVTNDGILPAELNDISFIQTNNGQSVVVETGDLVEDTTNNAILYSYYGIEKYSILPPNGSSVTFKVTVKYNENVQSQPTEAQLKSNLIMTLSYVQADVKD